MNIHDIEEMDAGFELTFYQSPQRFFLSEERSDSIYDARWALKNGSVVTVEFEDTTILDLRLGT